MAQKPSFTLGISGSTVRTTLLTLPSPMLAFTTAQSNRVSSNLYTEPASLDRISDRTLRHLVQYSSLINNGFRNQLLSSSVQPPQMRAMLKDPPQGSMNDFAFSEFPKLVTGELKLAVPVYTVWGACEDVAILEKIRSSPPSPLIVPSVPPTLESLASQSPTIQPNATSNYSIPNLTVLDEATTRVLLIGGVRLRLFGLGGAVVSHKLFDNGEGQATIAGGGGTMWTTVLQIGEIVDTAQRVGSRVSGVARCIMTIMRVADSLVSLRAPRSTTLRKRDFSSLTHLRGGKVYWLNWPSSSRPTLRSRPGSISVMGSATTSSPCNTTRRISGPSSSRPKEGSVRSGRLSRSRSKPSSSESRACDPGLCCAVSPPLFPVQC